MPENPWYPFYIGDYQQKTSHLTLIEHGAYGLLLNHYYATHHALPGDRKIIYRICRASDRNERRAIDSVLDQFFVAFDTESRPNLDRDWITTVAQSGIYFVHRKCEFEISKMLNYSKTQSANAKIRHSKRHMPNTMPNSCQTDARARVPQPQSEEVSKKDTSVSKKGSRFSLNDCPIEWIDFLNHERPELNAEYVFQTFRDYWIAKAGTAATKLDWFATWRNWVRNEKQQPKGNENGKSKIDNEFNRIGRKLTAEIERERQAEDFKTLANPIPDAKALRDD